MQVGDLVVPRDPDWLWSRQQDRYLLTVAEIYRCKVPHLSSLWCLSIWVDVLNSWGRCTRSFQCSQFAYHYAVRNTTHPEMKLESEACIIPIFVEIPPQALPDKE
jgi:hypothetical protein